MSTTNRILIAGFGGQGLLFAGKFLAYKGLTEGRQVSWLPSYGPEMRGGTCNCSVILSDEPVGSPIIENPDILMVMNRPSLDKFESTVEAGGYIFVDSALIDRKVEREDVKAFYIPATQMASDAGFPTLANMILVGKIIRETGAVSYEDLIAGLKKCVSARHQDLMDANFKAIDMGYRYEG